MRPGSPILRHAVRVAVVVAVGYLLGAALPFGHGYWAPMAAVMVMRPEFSQTYERSVARFGGTVVGVFLATVIVQAAQPGVGLAAVLAVVCALLMYLLMRTGYAVAQACISAYVVFLLGMAGEDWSQTVLERVVLTLVGGLLAMVSYAVYPAWETPRLRNRLGDWLASGGRYAASVVDQYADPGERGRDDVRAALLATREARIAWQEAVTTAQHEPVRNRGLSRAAADDTQHALAQFSRAAMLMEAHLPEGGATPYPLPHTSPTRCAVPPRRARRTCGSVAYRAGTRSVRRSRSGTRRTACTGRRPIRSCGTGSICCWKPWRSSPGAWTTPRPARPEPAVPDGTE